MRSYFTLFLIALALGIGWVLLLHRTNLEVVARAELNPTSVAKTLPSATSIKNAVVNASSNSTTAYIPHVALSPSVQRANKTLASTGSLLVTSTDKYGLPIFKITCVDDKCLNEVGIPLGNLNDVVAQMNPIDSASITKYQLKCNIYCVDQEGHIVGRPTKPLSSN